ncbi:TPA: PaaI family thioesterase [Burkholderia cepacia]|uniref:PaaI family thioesterase n=1 Tax=Burkholderia cepacia TaxID=292 RepID=UPI001CF294E9|nr:PaaI family thioesterase [Burkholderia cepacia]MCA8358223.1 PaaI family thioesterase [Burkholderia cepacia]HDR9759515.1 PaaI family thioesterase [Burkholderia cepacia ATCC 25416]HDV6365806.1 PaaI family thioesterase [Burkholderia cepacia]
MDETAARSAFESALQTYEPGFGTFFLARLLDLDITFPEDSAIVRFPVRDFLFNPGGTLHGGIIATVMDVSMGHLLNHTYGAGAATLEMKVQYLRPLGRGHARCHARFLQRGRSFAFLEARLYDDVTEKLAAVATSTWKAPPTEPPQNLSRLNTLS